MVSVPLPVSGDVLLEQELATLNRLRQTPSFTTGCQEIDDHLLFNGFESGSVVGISVEDDEFGLLVRIYARLPLARI